MSHYANCCNLDIWTLPEVGLRRIGMVTGRRCYSNKMESISVLIIAIAVVTVNLATGENDTGVICPRDLPFTTAMKVFHGTCYQFVSQEKYWHQARDYCLRHNGRLVKVDDPDTNRFIVASLNGLWWNNQGVWIGLHDTVSELHWQWTGYQLYENEPVRWTNWGQGHPRAFLHSHRDCVRMVRGSGDWKWHETFCNTLRWHYRFICEYKDGTREDDAVGANRRMVNAANILRNRAPASGHSVSKRLDEDTPSDSDDGAYAEAAVQSDRQRSDGSEKGTDGAEILAMVFGCILIGSLVIIVIFLLYRRRRRATEHPVDSFFDSSSSFSKAKVMDRGQTESNSLHPRVVSNIYVETEGKGRVKTKILPNSEVKDFDDSDACVSEDGENDVNYDEDDEDEEEILQQITSGKGAVKGAPNCARAVGNGQRQSPVEVKCESTKSANLYSEIPEIEDYPENGHIYEALEDMKY